MRAALARVRRATQLGRRRWRWRMRRWSCYASLYPFTGWRWPPGRSLGASAGAALAAAGATRFDVVVNLLGYLPLGALLYGAAACAAARAWRRGAGGRRAGAARCCRYAMEVLQSFLPARVPSSVDWALNSAGAAVGAALVAAAARGWAGCERWQALRERWFVARQRRRRWRCWLLWPIGLLFPTPVPLGLGQVVGAAARVAWSRWSRTRLGRERGRAAGRPRPSAQPLPPAGRRAGASCSACWRRACWPSRSRRRGWRRALLALARAALGVVGDDLVDGAELRARACAGLARRRLTLPALGRGHGAGAAWRAAEPRVAAGLGLVVLTALVALVSQAPADPYFADSLQSWEQGRFIRFHGLAQWVGWLWPYAAHGLAAGAPARGDATERLGARAAARRLPRIARMSYYEHHIFFCLNERDNGEACCAAARRRRRRSTTASRGSRREGLAGPGRRARQQGRLPRPLRRRAGGGGLPRGRLVHLCRRGTTSTRSSSRT